MEQWRDPCILPSNAPALDDNTHRRILQDTSGNVQSYALESKTGIENIHPVQHLPLDVQGTKSSNPNFYQPGPILGSNDRQSNLLRLQQRRQRHERDTQSRVESYDRTYLRTKKYLDYRARQRRDTGADGEQVWSEDVEDAFQDGKSLLKSQFMINTTCLLYKPSLLSSPWEGRRGPNMASPMDGMN